MTKIKVKPEYLYAEIKRVDEEQRVVEAYAFVNEWVKSSKTGISRAAMEEATPDYMKWANVREMHDKNSAAGVAETTVWDDAGAFMRVKVVDDSAWEKVKAKVYKGLSVGVLPEVMRGNSAQKVTWFETSLVDRPADPDAKILCFRSEGMPDEVTPDTEFDAEVDEAPEQRVDADGIAPDELEVAWFRGHFAEVEKANSASNTSALRRHHIYRAMDMLHTAVHNINDDDGDATDKQKSVRRAMGEGADYICRTAFAGNEMRAEDCDLGDLERALATPAPADPPADPASDPVAERPEWAAQIVQRLEAAEAGNQELTRRLDTAQKEVERLSNAEPAYHPVRFPVAAAGLPRDSGGADDAVTRRAKVQSRMAEILETRNDSTLSEKDRTALVMEYQKLKTDLASLAAASAAAAILG